MGNLHLVTGHAGSAHVTAADHASLNAAIFGEGEYVLNRGSKFATTIISNNSIRVADGDIIMQGRHIRLNEGSYVDLTIDNGSQGTNRNDLIVARYTKDSQTGVEDCNLVVIKGTAVSGTAADPAHTVGSIINDHVLQADMPLYRVPLNGLTVNALEPMFEVYSGQDMSRKYVCATGSAETLALSKATMTQLTLDTWKLISNSQFAFSDGGVVMPSAGTVLIYASVYFNTSSASKPEQLSVHVKQNGTELCGQITHCESHTACHMPPIMVTVAAGDVLHLCARNMTASGTCIPNARATGLTVIYL
jgi:hypothetical protein